VHNFFLGIEWLVGFWFRLFFGVAGWFCKLPQAVWVYLCFVWLFLGYLDSGCDLVKSFMAQVR
jgi:hypothetical protein